MNLGLDGKTALVLGGGGGLGGAIAQTLAAEGAKVAVADISLQAAEATVQTISKQNGSAIALEWDLADLSSIQSKVAVVRKDLGEIDILVNNTGGPPPTLASGQDPSLWRKHFESMVLSIIAITDEVLPAMRARKWGRVITSTSSGVITPIANLGISNALRLSLVGWSKTLAAEVGRDGVTANIVLPGRVATQRITSLDEQKAAREGRSVEDVMSQSVGSIPVGRYGTPEEYANVVAFVASARASYLTGSVIRVDGGLIPSI